jgi:tetratricopeptide (TPR) repeat protein
VVLMFKARVIGATLAAIALTVVMAGCAPVGQDKAQNALAAGRLDDAAYDIQAALARDPDNLTLKHLAAQIYTERGARYYKDGSMIAARQDFMRAIDYFPTYAQAYDYLGMLSFQQRDWQDAIKYGSLGAGYSGQPDPDYVKEARKDLRKIESGGLPPRTRPRGSSN